MKCAVHPEVDATGYCRNCGKALCADCARDVRGILYCETCLADIVSRPTPSGGGSSPGLAAVLGFVPGLGAVYNGEYTKALIHVAVFAGFIGILNSDFGDPIEPVAGFLLFAFIVYMVIDAYRTAKCKLQGKPAPMPMQDFRTDKPVGPILLIALGVLFLLGRHYRIGYWVREAWPVLFIALGGWLLWKRMGRTS